MHSRAKKITAALKQKDSPKSYGSIVKFSKNHPKDLMETTEFSKFLRHILDTVPIPIFVKDLKGKYIVYNKACENLSKIKRENILGKTDYDFFPKEIAKEYSKNDKKVLRTKKTMEFEEKGREHVTISVKSPFLDLSGKPFCICGAVVNITERKKIEELTNFQANILSQIDNSVISIDNNNVITYFNKATEKNYELGKDALGKNIKKLIKYEFVNPKNKENLSKLLASKGFWKGEIIFIRKNGEKIYAEASLNKLKDKKGNTIGILIVSRNITKRKNAEKEAEKLNKKISNILESIGDAFFTVDTNWKFTYVNKAAENLWKRKQKSIIGKSLWKVFPQLLGTVFEREYKKAMRTQKQTIFEEVAVVAKKWVEVRIYPSHDGLSVYVTDIAARREAEEEIKRQKEFSEKLINSSKDGIYAFDKNLNVMVWNPGIEEITGVKKEKVIGKNILKIPFIAKTGEVLNIKKVLEGEQISVRDKPFIINQTKKEGFFEANYSPLFNETNDVIGGIAIIHDITERKKLESRKDEFMAIASHELKTPVTTIKAFAQILDKRFTQRKDHQSSYFLKNINSQTDKLTALINDLLDVTKIEAGKLIFKRHEFDFDKLVRKIIVDFQYTTEKHEIMKQGEVKKWFMEMNTELDRF